MIDFSKECKRRKKRFYYRLYAFVIEIVSVDVLLAESYFSLEKKKTKKKKKKNTQTNKL